MTTEKLEDRFDILGEFWVTNYVDLKLGKGAKCCLCGGRGALDTDSAQGWAFCVCPNGQMIALEQLRREAEQGVASRSPRALVNQNVWDKDELCRFEVLAGDQG